MILLKKIDQGYVIGMVTIDLEKAFDLISFDILLRKLSYFGFDQGAINWFRDYFCGREQSTAVNGNMSSFRKVESGVPQGSILGPLLFILTLNDLVKSVKKCSLSLYADDTCVYFASKEPIDLETTINKDLLYISRWFSNNELLINIDKCQFLLLGSKAKMRLFENVKIKIQNTQLRRVTQCKYLGVMIDGSLTWTPQIDNVRKKVLQTFYSLKRIRFYIPRSTALLLYKSLIQPLFDYCSTVWRNGNEGQLNRLQVLQNRALRSVLQVDNRFNRATLYNTLEIDQLKERWEKQCILLVYKLVNNLAPPSLSSRIHLKSREYMLRNMTCQIELPRPHTNFLRKSPLYSASKLFNNLPANIRSENNLTAFVRFLSLT